MKENKGRNYSNRVNYNNNNNVNISCSNSESCK